MNMKYILSLLFLISSVCTATAGSVTAANITTVMMGGQAENSVFFVHINKNSTGAPPCHGAALLSRFVVSANTPGGKAVIASLLLALSMQKTISIYGTGTCSVWADTETIQWVKVNN